MSAPRRAPRRPVHGVLLFDKASGITSNAALQAVRRLYNAEKAGHTGTLDPLACGLLPLCFGEATKFAGELLDADKEYEATMRLGVTTDTADAEGRILSRSSVDVDRLQLEKALAAMVGDQLQLPPMYSALKRDGKPLYEYARAGIEVERMPRAITIYHLDLIEFEGESATFRVACSKGTYVRTLAADIGNALGCGAHLTALKRTRLGRWDRSTACSYEQLVAMTDAERQAQLRPVDALLSGLPAATLDDVDVARFGHGQAVSTKAAIPLGRVRVYSKDCFLGLAECDEAGFLQPRRLVAQ